jgi:hypothetical protein
MRCGDSATANVGAAQFAVKFSQGEPPRAAAAQRVTESDGGEVLAC